jgi:hypothetical protein
MYTSFEALRLRILFMNYIRVAGAHSEDRQRNRNGSLSQWG